MSNCAEIFFSLYAVSILFCIFVSVEAVGFDANGDRFCLAQNIYFESGNQPKAGRIAVAQVTLNRVNDPQFPDTVCDVVYQTKEYKRSWKTGELIPKRGMCQFSWYCDGKSDEPKDSVTWMESLRLADAVLNSESMDRYRTALGVTDHSLLEDLRNISDTPGAEDTLIKLLESQSDKNDFIFLADAVNKPVKPSVGFPHDL